MKWKHLGRTLLCLLLVCVLLVNVSPIRAEASAGALLGSIAGVTSVNVPAGLVYAAAAIALGVMAGTNDDFVNMVDYAVDTATDWVKDGTVELLRVVDDMGKSAYYLASDCLEAFRNDLIYRNIVKPGFTPVEKYGVFALGNCLVEASAPGTIENVFAIRFDQVPTEDTQYYLCAASSGELGINFSISSTSGTLDVSSYYAMDGVANVGDEVHHIRGKWVYGYTGPSYYAELTKHIVPLYEDVISYQSSVASSSLDLTLANFPSVPIDGSSALDWSEEYASKRIYVTGGSNDPDPPDENNGKWFWPVSLPLTAATLLAMSQADQWSGETPREFDQYTQNTEFEILNRPEFDGYQAIEIAPVTNPNPNPNPDVGEDPDIGGDSDTDSDAETTWFQRIVKGIEELPSKFGSWLNSIIEWLQKIWEAIMSLPEAIAEWIADVLLWAFIPSDNFVSFEITSLAMEFPLFESFYNTFSYLGSSFGGLGGEPPVIYMYLQDAEGSYEWGGTVAVLDMNWYARYKPTVDRLLSSLMWLFFIWRLLVHAPSIISGLAGDLESINIPSPGGRYLESHNDSPIYNSPYEKPARGWFEKWRRK